MNIHLYNIIQVIIVTSVVLKSAIYLATLFCPKLLDPYRFILFRRRRGKQTAPLRADQSQKTFCTQCHSCSGCQLNPQTFDPAP